MSQTMPITGPRGALFHDPALWADMDTWHRQVGELRRNEGIVHIDEPGYTEYWALLKHADVFAVSRDNKGWHHTSQEVLGTDADWPEIGRASCRESVCQYVEIPVVAVTLKKKK